MKSFITTNKHIENISEIEIKEILCYDLNSIINENVVIFDIKNFEDLAKIAYKAQSINRACLLLNNFEIETLDKLAIDFKKNTSFIKDIKDLIKNKTFKVECERLGNHDFKSTDVEIEIGKILFDELKKNKTNNKTEYDNPEVIFYFFINQNKVYFGLDFSGFDLSKRQYKIFNHNESLKGNVAYSLLRLADFDKKKCLLDPFMGSGTILIEAALYVSNFPVQYYNKNKLSFTKLIDSKKIFESEDKKIKKIKKAEIYGYDYQMRYLEASKKNAKLAGIDKIINLSKCEIEWLDTKLKKNSIDFIITDPPRYSKNRNEKDFEKIYNELFYQSDYILKKNSFITILGKENSLLYKASEKHNFKIVKKYLISQGQEIFNVLCFTRK
ncbi:MAG: THUMP domain-containing protein [Candidatus Woesearchaeota archaeon]